MAKHEINLKIHEESDLFTPLDPDQNQLSTDVIDYFFRGIQSARIHKREKCVIRVMSDMPVDEEKVKEKIRGHFCREIEDLRQEFKRLRLKAICLAVFGIIILSLWLYLSSTSENINIEILSIMGWVAVWEVTGILIMERPKLRRAKKEFEQMRDAEIIVSVSPIPAGA